MSRSRLLTTLFAASAALALPPAADAAFNPKLSVTVTPTDKPGEAVQITTRVTMPSTDTATKKTVVKFPVGFQPRFESSATVCEKAQEDARACPAESQLGSASASAGPGGAVKLSGGVFFGGPDNSPGAEPGTLRILVFVQDSTGLEKQKLVGIANPAGENGTRIVNTFDNLPNVNVSDLTLTLEGAPKSLANASFDCGVKTFDAEFESQSGEKATSSSDVTITGCPPENTAPVLSGVSFAKRVSGKPAAARLKLNLDERADVVAIVKRAGKRVSRRDFTAKPGNTFFKPLPKKLKPGAYTLTVRATDAEGLASRKVVVKFTVLKPKPKPKPKARRR